MVKSPKVTISLLSWNGHDYLPWLLKSLQAQTFTDWELLVLDNGSSDNSVATIKENYPPAKIIQQKTNIGFARGHNLLVNWSKSDYILFLNQDVVLANNYLSELVQFLEDNPNVASVSGKLLYWDFHSSVKSKIIDSLGLKINRQRKVVDKDQGKKNYQLDNQEVFGLSATALLVRRSALETVKFYRGHNQYEYFDEDFFSYKEDIDLAWRWRLYGWENWLVTSTEAYHHRTVSGLKSGRQNRRNRKFINRLSYRNHLAMLYKNSFTNNFFKDFFLIIWYELRKFIYFLIFEQSTLKGLGEFIKLQPKFQAKRKQIRQDRHIKAADIYRWFE